MFFYLERSSNLAVKSQKASPATSPRLYPTKSRRTSTSSYSSLDDDFEDSNWVPLERMTVLELLDPFAVGTQITKKFNTTVRKKGGEFKNMALRQRDRVMKVNEDDVERLKRKFLKEVNIFEGRLTKALDVSATEKIAFAFGVLNLFYGGYIIGMYPEYFHIFYTVELFTLMPIRFFTYRYKQYQYFLADLCYFVNFLCIIFIWVWPTSEALFVSCYALTFGTLSWAVITWRNSLVLHSVEKTTSSVIHILPPVVFHVITHIISPDYKAERFPGANKVPKWRMVSGLLWASLTYLVWQSLYHYFITVRRKEQIKAGRMTSFEWLRKSYANTKLGKFVNGLPEPFPVVAFTAIQYGYQLSTMLLCPIWYSSSLLSGSFMTFILFVAAYNGATYYIDFFGKRFQKELLKLQAEVQELNNRNGTTPSSSTTSLSGLSLSSSGVGISTSVSPTVTENSVEERVVSNETDNKNETNSTSKDNNDNGNIQDEGIVIGGNFSKPQS